MKKTTWKKIMSLVMAVALVIGALSFSNRVSASVDPSAAAEGEVTSNGINPTVKYDVTYTAGETDATYKQYTMVIAIDTSGSMKDAINSEGQSRLAVALEQANTFVAALEAQGNVDISYITFGTDASDVSSFSGATADGGTNIDDAIEHAEAILTAEGVTNPILVILSDGEATYANRYSAHEPWRRSRQNGGYWGNGSDETNSDVIRETAAEIQNAVNAGIAIYAINYGGDGTTFSGKQGVNYITSGLDAESLAAAFHEILEAAKPTYVTRATIIAELGDYVELVGEYEGVEVKDGKLTWEVPAASATNPSASVSLQFTVKRDALGLNADASADDVIKALVKEAEKSDQITVSGPDNDGKITVNVVVTTEGNTTLTYVLPSGEEVGPDVLDTGDTLALTAFIVEPLTWTVVYTVNGEVLETEEAVTFEADRDKTLAEIATMAEGYTLADYDNNEDYDLGDITATTDNGNIVTIPYTYNKVDWKVIYQVDGVTVETDTETYKKVGVDEPFETLENYKTTEELGYGDYSFEDAALDRDFDNKVWTVNYKSIPTVNYFIGNDKIATMTDDDVAFVETENGSLEPVFLTPAGIDKEKYDNADFDLEKTNSSKVDGVKVWNVIFTKKGTTDWYIKYTLDGEDLFKMPQLVATLNEDVKFVVGDYAKKLSELGLEYTDIADGLVETETKEPTENAPTTYEVAFSTQGILYTVKYVVDNTPIMFDKVDGKTEFVKYDLKTGKADLDINKYTVPVSELGTYIVTEYDDPTVAGPDKDHVYVITYAKKAVQQDPDPVDPIVDPVITQPVIIIPPIVTETPEEPTPTPTAEPTPEPTAEPTPVEEEPIVVEEPETPEGDVVEDLEPVDTPQSAPEEEELDVEPIDTPQGDLPKTGVAPSAVFFGIGAACVVFGGAIVLKLRRKEEM